MDKITLELTDELSAEVFYSLEDDQVIITDINLLTGTLFDLLQWLDYQTMGGTINYLEDKINDELILGFDRMVEGEDDANDLF